MFNERTKYTWQDSLQESLDIFFILDEQTREDFIEILWNDGILNHIAPTDPAVIAARKSKGRPVWDQGRDDHRLYWKILYSAAAAKEACGRDWSMIAGSDSFVAGIFSPIYEAFSRGLLQKFYPNQTNPQIVILSDITERAKQELEKRNQNTAGHPLGYGLNCTWRGLELKVDRFTGDGKIYFQAKSLEDHVKLYELAKENDGFVLPWEINPEDFN
ncbi:hypothetical protein HYW46_01970 [Candidatus Daviesbacteria bacterium]|nr:hypothetical protein [Candidatus Daviesbacteria bacterium]